MGLLTGPVAEITSLDPATGSAPVRPGTLVSRVHVHAGQALNLLNEELLFTRIGRLCLAEDIPSLRQPASALPAGA